MQINQTILKKVQKETADDEKQNEFLTKILNYESDSPGHYKNQYQQFLNDVIMEEE